MAIDRIVFAWFSRVASFAFACLLVLMLSPQRLLAQVDEGAINGVVTIGSNWSSGRWNSCS